MGSGVTCHPPRIQRTLRPARSMTHSPAAGKKKVDIIEISSDHDGGENDPEMLGGGGATDSGSEEETSHRTTKLVCHCHTSKSYALSIALTIELLHIMISLELDLRCRGSSNLSRRSASHRLQHNPAAMHDVRNRRSLRCHLVSITSGFLLSSRLGGLSLAHRMTHGVQVTLRYLCPTCRTVGMRYSSTCR
jgi:hypothetical protein